MIQRYGIDTSILVRLLTGDPAGGFKACVARLTALIEAGAEVLASNQVIGESYIAVQHHYGVTKAEARAALLSVLTSGLVSPSNGAAVLDALQANKGCGLIDRLIVDEHRRRGITTLTLDRKMAALSGAVIMTKA